MATQFRKHTDDFLPKWSMYFHAGTEWLQTFQLLEDEHRKKMGGFLFWVYPHVLYFSLELFVKALAAHKDPTFNAKSYRHSATAIVKKYADAISSFNKMVNNQPLMDLVQEYEKTFDTRFGETGVQLEGADTKMMIDTVYELREDMCRRTGLR